MLRWSRPEIGSLLIDVILSINEQTKERFQDEINLASYSDLRPTLHTLQDIWDALQQVCTETDEISGHAGEYLRGVTAALACYLRILQGDRIDYVQSIHAIQQLPVGMIGSHMPERLTQSLAQELGDMGYRGAPAEKITRFLADHRIAPERVLETAGMFQDKARRKTIERIVPMPQGEGIDEIKGVTGVYWSGFSQYVSDFRGTLTFNTERPWSLPTFSNVMTHETYPGHQAFYARWDALFQAGKWPLEAAYYFTGMPDNALFEGAPETALHFLDWDSEEGDADFSKEQKRLFRIGRDILDLQRVYQTNASFLVNGQGETTESAVKYMMDTGLFQQLEAQNTCRFFTDPIQRTYYPSYFYGKVLVQRAYDLFPEKQRSKFFEMLYDIPHTTDTFIKAVSDELQITFSPFADL